MSGVLVGVSSRLQWNHLGNKQLYLQHRDFDACT